MNDARFVGGVLRWPKVLFKLALPELMLHFYSDGKPERLMGLAACEGLPASGRNDPDTQPTGTTQSCINCPIPATACLYCVEDAFP